MRAAVLAVAVAASVVVAPPASAAPIEPPPGGDVCNTREQPVCPEDPPPCTIAVFNPRFYLATGVHGSVVNRSELRCLGEDFKQARTRLVDRQRMRRVEKRTLLGCDRCAPDCDRCVPDIMVTVSYGPMTEWSKKRYQQDKLVTPCKSKTPSRRHETYVYVQVELDDGTVLDGRFRSDGQPKGPCHVDWDNASHTA